MRFLTVRYTRGMGCEELARMRADLQTLHREAKHQREHARAAERSDRRSRNRGRSDALAYIHRRLHRAAAALERHIIVHRCQE
jgi:hypothetical protein